MRDQVLWRKEGRIVELLAEHLNINYEQALTLFYNSHTYVLLANPESGLNLQSDRYILAELLDEYYQQHSNGIAERRHSD